MCTSVCNMADDTTPYACDMDLPTLITNLEGDTASTLFWFEANYMKLNPDKCHFLMSNPKEHIWIKVGEQVIWESQEEKLLGVTLDKKLKFDKHLSIICKKARAKVTALARLAKLVTFEKKRILMNAFIVSQFSYCPLVWMFCSREMNRKINRIHERALRMVYLDYTSSFDDLLRRDNTVSIHHRNIQLLAVEMFKVKNGLSIDIMQNLFNLNGNGMSNRSFLIPNIISEYKGKDSVRYFGPVVWDCMLPGNYKCIQTLENFKTEIKKWVPNNCPCRLCKCWLKRRITISYMLTEIMRTANNEDAQYIIVYIY